MATKLSLRHDNVLILPAATKGVKRRDNGMITSDLSTQPELAKGTVVAFGSGSYLPNGELAPVELSQGDEVLYEPAAIRPLTLEDTLYHLVGYFDVKAVITSAS